MRLGLALGVFLLAGCAAPETTNPLLGYCPQWVQAPGEHRGAFDGGSGAQILTPQNLTYQGRPFDLVRLRIDSVAIANGTGSVELRAYAMDNGTRGSQRTWRDFSVSPAQLVPVLKLDGSSAGKEFEVTLTSIAQEDPARPGPLELVWWLPQGATAHVVYVATYHHKVCGVQAPAAE